MMRTNITNGDILQAQRMAHVEQAKAHLRAALHTYYSTDESMVEFDALSERVNEFIAYLEDEAPGIA